VEKPKPKQQEPAYDYHECEAWINEKYSIDIDNYSKTWEDRSRPYQNFWHWILGLNEIHNGCYFRMDFDTWSREEVTPAWVKEILTLFVNEFPPNDGGIGEFRFWVSW